MHNTHTVQLKLYIRTGSEHQQQQPSHTFHIRLFIIFMPFLFYFFSVYFSCFSDGFFFFSLFLFHSGAHTYSIHIFYLVFYFENTFIVCAVPCFVCCFFSFYSNTSSFIVDSIRLCCFFSCWCC